MPGLRMYKSSYYSNIGANEPIRAGTINIGCLRGRGSTTRMFAWCKQKSPNPSGCINQFVTFPPTTCPQISLSSISTLDQNSGYWVINKGATVLKCQTLNINNGEIVINYPSNNTFTNNGTINITNGVFGNYGDTSLTIVNNGTITVLGNQSFVGNFGNNGSPNFINNSYININEGGTLENFATSTFTNNGYISLNNNALLQNYSISNFYNNGKIILNNSSSLNNRYISIFNNNYNIIDINGSSIINYPVDGSLFTNSGTIYDGTAGGSTCSSGTYTNLTTPGTILPTCGP
jgi:hypothetical protein